MKEYRDGKIAEIDRIKLSIINVCLFTKKEWREGKIGGKISAKKREVYREDDTLTFSLIITTGLPLLEINPAASGARHLGTRDPCLAPEERCATGSTPVCFVHEDSAFWHGIRRKRMYSVAIPWTRVRPAWVSASGGGSSGDPSSLVKTFPSFRSFLLLLLLLHRFLDRGFTTLWSGRPAECRGGDFCEGERRREGERERGREGVQIGEWCADDKPERCSRLGGVLSDSSDSPRSRRGFKPCQRPDLEVRTSPVDERCEIPSSEMSSNLWYSPRISNLADCLETLNERSRKISILRISVSPISFSLFFSFPFCFKLSTASPRVLLSLTRYFLEPIVLCESKRVSVPPPLLPLPLPRKKNSVPSARKEKKNGKRIVIESAWEKFCAFVKVFFCYSSSVKVKLCATKIRNKRGKFFLSFLLFFWTKKIYINF